MQEVPTRPANQAPTGADADAGPWLVSYADDDDREMTATEIFRALGTGEIDMESIAWRDGMAEWQAIGEIAALRAELERVAGTRGDRKRTVMGGFAAQQAGGRGAAGSSAGAAPRAAVPVATQLQSRSTLLGTGAQPLYGITGAVPAGSGAAGGGSAAAGNAKGLSSAVPNPRVGDLEPGADARGPLKTANSPKAALKSSPLARQPVPPAVQAQQAPPEPDDDGPESWDQEPTVSLHHDSIVSLPPEALESVVAFLPPMDAPSSPRGIFEIDSKPPPQFVIQNAPGARQHTQAQRTQAQRTQAQGTPHGRGMQTGMPDQGNATRRGHSGERASESILDEPMHFPAPQGGPPTPMRSHVQAPHPPRPVNARGPDSPLPPTPFAGHSSVAPHGSVAPLGGAPSAAGTFGSAAPGVGSQVNPALSEDTFVSTRAKGGSFGRYFVFLLLAGGIGAGMFYMGRTTAVAPKVDSVTANPVPAPSPQPGAATAAHASSGDDATPEAPAEAKDAVGQDSAGKDSAGKDSAGKDSAGGQSPSKEAVSGTGTPTNKGRSTGSSGGSARSPEPKPASGGTPSPEPEPKAAQPAPPPSSDAPFDTSAASAALTKAAGNASSCRQGSDPSGVANVTVTFSNSGRAINANVSGPPFAGTVTGGCIASKMRQAIVPPFGGDRITVRKQVVIQ
jgi:hypothetical protein